MPNKILPEQEENFPDFDFEEFDYKNTDDLAHKRRLRKLLEDRMAAKKLKEACKEEWDEEEDEEFEWQKLDI